MTIRYLKSRKDGTIFERDDILAARSDMYEVSEQEAFPERFIPVEAVESVAKKRGRQRHVALDMSTANIPEPPVQVNDALNADASRDLPS